MLEEVTVPRLVVAGLGSGAGKTSISLGLVAALQSRGRVVQTFKVGPDFIDCAYLAHASRRPCRNLDSWMLGDDGVQRSLAHGVVGADAVVVEGVMGIFDGHGMATDSPAALNADRFPGSTAEVARLIAAPVVLVLDAWSMSETAAAVALGIKQLDLAGSVIGVILNNVPSDYRRRIVEDAVWTLAQLPVLGALPRIDSVRIPELRTGLLPLTQNPHVDEAIEQLGRAVQRDCDLDLIERLMTRARPLRLSMPARRVAAAEGAPVRIGVAFDDAFCCGRGDRPFLAARGSLAAARHRRGLPRRRRLGSVRAATRGQSLVHGVTASRSRARTARLRGMRRPDVLRADAAHQRRLHAPDDGHRARGHRSRGGHAAHRLPRPSRRLIVPARARRHTAARP
ncbi:MAG: hypothetical protein E6J45_05970 [Chloroflexi bacterium]|nr:MAG: hypothetical protein E6J45_05970 [Chloroflexota bacterium]